MLHTTIATNEEERETLKSRMLQQPNDIQVPFRSCIQSRFRRVPIESDQATPIIVITITSTVGTEMEL